MPTSPGPAKFGYVLSALVGVQLYTGFFYNLPPVYAPALSEQLGFAPQSVGFYYGILMAATLVGALVNSQLLPRVGALRMCQVALVLQSVGIAFAMTGSTFWLIASAIVGGVGNGTTVPAAVQTLVRSAPPGRLATCLALTQLGPPGGAALAGAIIPSLLEAIGWQRSLIPTVIVGAALALALQPLRQGVDHDLDPHFRLRIRTLFAPWILALTERSLRGIGFVLLIVAFISSVNTAFLVIYLNVELHYSLFLAGIVLTGSQAGVMVGRMLIGWIADRLGDPLPLLRWLTVVTGALTILTGFLAHLPVNLAIGLVVFTMTVSQSWFAVFLAAVARNAPPGKSGMATAGVQVFPIAATTAGPIIFAALVSALGRYSSAYIVCGAAALIIGVGLLALARTRDRRKGSSSV